MIEEYNRNRHNSEAVTNLLTMAVGRPTPEKLTQLLDEFYTMHGHTIFVALQDDKIFGIIGLDFTGRPHGLITHLAVKAEMRKQGIARNLINHVSKAFRLTKIEAETDQDAVDFYRACGFEAKVVTSRWSGVRRFRCSKDIKALM